MSGLGGRPEWLGLLDLPQGGQLGGRPSLFSHSQVLLSFVIVYSFGLAYRARMILAAPAVIEFDALIFEVTAHLSVPAVLPALLGALVSAFAVDDHDAIAVFFASHLLALLVGALTEQHWLGGETDAVDELLPGSRGFLHRGTVFLGVRLELGVGFEVFVLLDLLLVELLLPVKGKQPFLLILKLHSLLIQIKINCRPSPRTPPPPKNQSCCCRCPYICSRFWLYLCTSDKQ